MSRLSRTGRTRQAVFLDRDGTINRNEVRDGKPYAPTRLEDFEILPGVAEAITRFREAGYLVIVVTNQPDLTTGKVPAAIIHAMHAQVRKALGVDDILVCPHTEAQKCGCRKPKPGLILEAVAKWRIDPTRSVMVGDRWRDIAAGKAAGCITVLVGEGYAAEPMAENPDLVGRSLGEIAGQLLARLQCSHR